MFAAQKILSRPSAFQAVRRLPQAASFHASPRAFVKVGDKIPNVELMEGSPGNKVSIADELKGKGLIIGVPAAFSPSCSEKHIPGYMEYANLKEAGNVFVVSVNDPFVMKAWGLTLDPQGKSGIRFLADPHATLTNALDLAFDSTAIFGQPRSKRYALVVEDGKVSEAHVEPDNTGVNVSTASKVLGRS
ncbi:peroxiredoxin [Hortaea werneckii]|nr:peroxiredoxin [Hortaea werneckii]KAI7096161.1 peroxiredoxin [Hortaea werneckii]KAI7222556.1 peroxiredoxin [Hortaea werneckii]KAI7320195.1 peroxiredoxin [Hortaea werneckii]KAI7399911.1 peroxiredoxin [Hortaea werneckii]